MIDPAGLALENFDAIGGWRTRDGGTRGAPVDASGQLIDGTQINGVVELRAALLREPEIFVRTMTEKLMTYALGRGLTATDMRFLDLTMALLFAFAAALQFNDPDPIQWIAIYSAACVLSLLAATRRRVAPAALLAVFAIAIVWGALIAFGGPAASEYGHMARIGQDRLDEGKSSLVAIAILDGFHAAKLQQCLAPRFDERQAGPNVLFRLHRNVFFEFGPQEFFVPRRRHPRCQPMEEPPCGLHFTSSPFTAKKRSMIAAVCSQLRASVCSCLRPCRVSR